MNNLGSDFFIVKVKGNWKILVVWVLCFAGQINVNTKYTGFYIGCNYGMILKGMKFLLCVYKKSLFVGTKLGIFNEM